MKKYVVAVIMGENYDMAASEIEDRVDGDFNSDREYCNAVVDELIALDKDGARYNDFSNRYPNIETFIYTFNTEAEYEAFCMGLDKCTAWDEKTWFSKEYDDGAPAPYRPVAWQVSEDDLSGEDFANYDTSTLTPQQIYDILEEIDTAFGENDQVGDIFRSIIDDVAQSHGLKKRS